jgi:hypothetical protein
MYGTKNYLLQAYFKYSFVVSDKEQDSNIESGPSAAFVLNTTSEVLG